MSGTLALASAIAEMDRVALHALVARRRPQAAGAIGDPIGLAAELLRSESIHRALPPLDRAELRTLLALADQPHAAQAEAIAPLRGVGLVGHESGHPVALPEVTAAVTDALTAAGVSPAVLRDGTAAGPSDPDSPFSDALARSSSATGHDGGNGARASDTSTWYSPALTAVGQAAECLRVLAARPSKLNRNGTVAVVSLRALAESTSITVESVSRILTALGYAGLTTPRSEEQLLLVSESAPEWLARDSRDRWIALADALLAALPEPLRATLARSEDDLAAAAAAIPHRFPLLPASELEAARAFNAVAEQLGITVGGRLSAPAQCLLAEDHAAARELVAQQVPDLAPGVYVQPDLSVVIPGPLSPTDEATLGAVSRPEQIGVASTRRITDASIAEGLEQGVTPEAARALFARISLSGIPQPLEYLLMTRADRLGDLVVDEHHGEAGRTRLTIARPELADTLLVDRALQHLQLTRPVPLAAAGAADGVAAGDTAADDTAADGGTKPPVRLFSRLRADHVLAALTDARYQPTTGAALTGTRRTAPPSGTVGPATAAIPIVDATPAAAPEALSEAHAALIERVYLAARAEPGTGDFTRRLELAMRDRSPVVVTAEAGGQVRSFTLLPVSVANGRLRATDQIAGVERTLPVNMITAVDPA